MDLERYARKLQDGPNGAALKKLADSEAGAALSKQIDGAALERAAKAGDSKALAELLRGILSTPEGAGFAAQVKKAVDGGGR